MCSRTYVFTRHDAPLRLVFSFPIVVVVVVVVVHFSSFLRVHERACSLAPNWTSGEEVVLRS